jgi:murein DD-endopeptidase MepM/ murein hydrolase activator NlpD
MKKLIKYILIIVVLASIYILWADWRAKKTAGQPAETPVTVAPPEEKKDRVSKIEIVDGATYGNLMSTSGVAYDEAMAIYGVAQPLYDLVKVRIGRFIELVYDKDTDELKELKYKIDTEDELHVRNVKYFAQNNETASGTAPIADKKWTAKIEPIPYEIKIKTAGGTVSSSMYQAALDSNIDIKAIIELADAFQWTIDFAMDPRVGDTFKFVYEERFLDGEYVMPGKIFAGRYVNDGQEYYVYYFEENKDNIGFFDKDGNSVQKMFLKAPVAFKYISSPFTTGMRYIEAFNVSTGHRAVDYAAAQGTPIRAVGDGTVTSAGWRAGYGNLTSIRHNSTYSTNYGHQSKFAVKKGVKVKQGQVIGYVGSTGFSTGPHLHYEMVKNGVKVNPMLEVLPPGEPIKQENRDRFFAEVEKYKTQLQ